MSEQVFISYDSDDENIAEQIYTKLESSQISTWIASKDISGGQKWHKVIPEKIKECDSLVVIVTDSSKESDYVANEVKIAIDNDLNVLPVSIDNTDIGGGLTMFISNYQLEFVEKPIVEEDIAQIRDSLKKSRDSTGNIDSSPSDTPDIEESHLKVTDGIPNEAGVERSVLHWLDDLGWETHGQSGGRGAETLDTSYNRTSREIIYWELLEEQLIDINDAITEENVDKFIGSLRSDIGADNLMDGNQAFHELLTKGKSFDVQRDGGSSKSVYIDLIDYDNPENNRFHAVNQFSVSRQTTIRPDINLFVNGIPVVTMELKGTTQDNDWQDAVADIRRYEKDVPRLFVPGLFNIAADTMELRYGAVGATTEFYEPWNDASEEYESDNRVRQAIDALCNHESLLDMIENFVLYERQPGGNAKIVPRYMQYYAVNQILDRVNKGEHDRGLIWHTQGSGKSFTMLYAAKNLLSRPSVVRNPQVLIIVDTDKLDTQMSNQLSNISIENWTRAESIDHLQQLIEEGQSQIVLTTIHKFENVDPEVQGNDEVIVMSDEAHRFMEADLGSRLDAALPDSYHFGFTGTPVREGEKHKDRNTFREFSPEDEEYLHRYSIRDGIDDDVVLPVYFTLCHQMEWEIDEAELDMEFEEEFSGLSVEQKQEVIREEVTATKLAEIEPRLDQTSEKIYSHYKENVAPNGWKGMVVTPSRRSAAMYGERLIDKLGEEAVEVLYTATKDDSDLIKQFHTEGDERDSIVNSFKENEDPQLLVVHQMLLTGFDAPILKTMYLDRNLKNHNLMQAIARTNRPAPGKENGEIVDFQGVFEHIDDALDYSQETQEYAARDKEKLFDDLKDQVDEVISIFEGIPKDDTQEATYEAVEHVSTHPERREFKQGFRDLQNLYEAVAPDERIVKQGIEQDYKWLNRIHIAFKRTTSGDDEPEEDMQEKTLEIINEHVDVSEIKNDFPTYKLGSDVLEDNDDLENPSVKASQIAHAARDHLHPRENQNPRYKRLSDRVTDIVERWKDGDMEDAVAVEALETVEESITETESESEELGMNDAEYAIYLFFKEQKFEEIESISQASDIADSITSKFEDCVDRGYSGWKKNQETKTKILEILIEVLKEYDLGHLLLDDSQTEDTIKNYLIQNYD